MYVVMGATGNTGSVVADTLLDKGAPVRVVVRDAKRAAALAARGAEVVEADVRDATALAAALAGARGAYLLSPPAYQSEDPLGVAQAMGATLAEAARRAALPHAVVLSSVTAHLPTGTGIIEGLHAVERAVRGAGVPVTFLRAAFFLENWAGMLEPVRTQGVLPSMALPLDRPFEMVAVADIGRVAAELLLAGPAAAGIVELSGPAEWSPQDVARAFAAAVHRDVQAVPVPREQWEPILEGVGLSRPVAALMAAMYDGINAGRVGFEGGGAVRRRGGVDIATALARLADARAAA